MDLSSRVGHRRVKLNNFVFVSNKRSLRISNMVLAVIKQWLLNVSELLDKKFKMKLSCILAAQGEV